MTIKIEEDGMRRRNILRASAPMLAGAALAVAATGGMAQAPPAQSQPPLSMQQQPAPAQVPTKVPAQIPDLVPVPAPAAARGEAPKSADCPDPETAGAPVVDEATVRQFEDAAPAPDRVLPEGETDTPDTVATPVPGAPSNGAAPEQGGGEQAGISAPCPPAGEATGVEADAEVIESQSPGITELGLSPPSILHEESTLGLQQLIDRAHGGSTGITQPGGGTRQVAGQPPTLQDGSAPREQIAPQ